MFYVLLIIAAVTFVITLIKCAVCDLTAANNKPPPIDETSDTDELNATQAEKIENYDRQIDGYTQLIKTLDNLIKSETDEKKKAGLMAKQLVTLEKLNKTIEKREKLDS